MDRDPDRKQLPEFTKREFDKFLNYGILLAGSVRLDHADWTINLLLVRDGEPYFSVIHDPLHNETYWAEKNRGAFLNDGRIRVIGRPDIGLMLTATSHPPFPSKFPGLSARIGKGMQAKIETFSFVRNLGPTALQIAYVAAGRLDVFYEDGLDTFNWLPGVLIAQEAGAEVLTSRGIPWTCC